MSDILSLFSMDLNLRKLTDVSGSRHESNILRKAVQGILSQIGVLGEFNIECETRVGFAL